MNVIVVACLLCMIPGDVRLPVVALPVTPAVPVEPQPVQVLPADAFYVVESDVPLLVVQVPAGLVTVNEETGPIRLRGRFAGGDGKVETRQYTAQHVYAVEAASVGVVELLFVPVGVQQSNEIVRTKLTVMGLGPKPPPSPEPPSPEPPAPQPPAPQTGPLQVLVVVETEDIGKLPPGQIDALMGSAVRGYLASHCRKSTGTTPDFRMLDEDATLENAEPWVKAAFALPRSTLPWVAISNGVTGTAQPLPATPEAFLELLQKYGGP